MSFPKQAALATVVIAASVGGLVWLGQRRADSKGATPPDGAAMASPSAASTAPGTDSQPLRGAIPRGPGAEVRLLVPSQAWAVADFRGDLSWQKPFAGEEGLCASVPAPSRVAVAVLPPVRGQEPDLLIAARRVDDAFWSCARDRIVRAGGTALAQNERFEVLKSPTGVVARGPDGSMVFLTSDGHLESALSAVSDLGASSLTEGAHARLYQKLKPASTKTNSPGAGDSALDLTVSLPNDWLASVGQDANKSPLRFVRSGFMSVHEDGSAQGGIDCDEAGCPEVVAFLTRAKTDALAYVPPEMKEGLKSALRVEHVQGAGRIAITWSPQGTSLGALLGRFLPSGLGN